MKISNLEVQINKETVLSSIAINILFVTSAGSQSVQSKRIGSARPACADAPGTQMILGNHKSGPNLSILRDLLTQSLQTDSETPNQNPTTSLNTVRSKHHYMYCFLDAQASLRPILEIK